MRQFRTCERCGAVIRRFRLLPHRCRAQQVALWQGMQKAPGFRGGDWFRFVRVEFADGEMDYSLDDPATAIDLFLELLRLPSGTRLSMTVSEMTMDESRASVETAEEHLDALLGGKHRWREAVRECARKTR